MSPLLFLKAAGALAALLAVGYGLWRLLRPTPVPPRRPIQLVNIERRVIKGMRRELKAMGQGDWSAKRVKQGLRKQRRAQQNGEPGDAA